MKSAIYARVSTDDQAERATIETQLAACRDYCSQHGYEVVGEFLDEGVSGTMLFDERPAGRRLVEMADARKVDVIVAYRLDRIGRDTFVILIAIKRLTRKTAIEYVTETFDNSPSGSFQQTIMAGMAQLERELIFDRTSKGRLRNITAGRLYQAPIVPYGYRRTADKLIEEDPDTGPVVRQMFELAKAGLGSQRIATRLDELGVPPPMLNHPKRKGHHPSWNWTSVYDMLRSKRYIGQGSYAGQPMPCPALVDDATFAAVQDSMAKRKLNSPRSTSHSYLLQHLVYCGVCGGRYTPRTSKRRTDPDGHVTYSCFRRGADGGVKSPHGLSKWTFSGAYLETTVCDFVEQTVFNGNFVGFEIDIPDEDDENSGLGAEKARLRKAESDLESLDVRAKNHIRAHGRGTISDDDLEGMLQEVDAERVAAETVKSDARQRIAEATNVIEKARTLFAWLRENTGADGRTVPMTNLDFRNLAFEAKRDFLRKVLDKVTVTDVGSGLIEFRFEGRINDTLEVDEPHEPTLRNLDFRDLKPASAKEQRARATVTKSSR